MKRVLSLGLLVLLLCGCSNKELESLKEQVDNNTKIIEELKKENESLKKRTITKEELIGTWEYVGDGHSSITFTEDNVEVIDDWIIYKGNMSVYYMYKDGILYITDDGISMKKQEK